MKFLRALSSIPGHDESLCGVRENQAAVWAQRGAKKRRIVVDDDAHFIFYAVRFDIVVDLPRTVSVRSILGLAEHFEPGGRKFPKQFADLRRVAAREIEAVLP